MATAPKENDGIAPVARFRRDLDALADPQLPIGIAVSGGPDSLALLLMAAEARPLLVEAATVDHALRPESRAEAEMVAAVCEKIGVPHTILTVEWPGKPTTAIQERARHMRFRLLGAWARERGIGALATGHHLDDQAETLLMRLARGAGVGGLAAMRRLTRSPDGEMALVRPLLGWRHAELEAVCAAAGIAPIDDPSNGDETFERVRARKFLADNGFLEAPQLAASAAHLAQAEAALIWAVGQEWKRAVRAAPGEIVYRPNATPREIARRIIARAVLALGTEGGGSEFRGRELDQLLAALTSGRRATLRGVLCTGGSDWRFTRAPARRS